MMKGYVWVLLLAMTITGCVDSYEEGVNAYNAQDYQTALREFLPLANGGDATAQAYLGIMYYYGNGVPQDYSQALYWYRKAAEQGNSSAQRNLGIMYQHGNGVPKDYSQAEYWYRKSAAQGDAWGQFNLESLGRY